MKKFNKIILLAALMVIFLQCQKEHIKIQKNGKIKDTVAKKSSQLTKKENELPVSYAKLELILGRQFEAVQFKIANIDNDVNEEFVILYTLYNNPRINIAIFDILPNEVLKKLFNSKTDILYNNHLSMQTTNLFQENDSFIVIEGKSRDDKHHLYLFSYQDGEFLLADHFSGSFSVFINYEEKESTEAKYFLLKEIVVIDKANGSSTASIQKKEVYSWDYLNRQFKLVESSQIISSKSLNIDYSIYYSIERYFKYINGFWYPEQYQQLIEQNDSQLLEYSSSNIQFLYLNENNSVKEISISHGEYIDKYIVQKIIKLGGQKPGLRLILKDYSYTNSRDHKYMDVYLLNTQVLKVIGPKRFQNSNYVRLSQPFVEIVNQKKERASQDRINEIKNYLDQKIFTILNYYPDTTQDLNLKFESTRFSLYKNEQVNQGEFKLIKESNQILLILLYENEINLINEKYFLFDFNPGEDTLTLIPVDFKFNQITIKNTDPLTFKKNKG